MTNQTPQHLSLIIASPDIADEADSGVFREAGPIDAVRRMIVGRKEVSLEKVQTELQRVQGELDQVLANVRRAAHHGFTLSEVEVSLAISGEGSIGVVTAGVEAAITLHFTTGTDGSQPGR